MSQALSSSSFNMHVRIKDYFPVNYEEMTLDHTEIPRLVKMLQKFWTAMR